MREINPYLYNLHCHTLLSDGDLLPSEVAARFSVLGYRVIALTDHADYSNIKAVLNQTMEFCKRWPKDSKIKILPGVELTHLPLKQFKPLAGFARKQGARVIIGHGETPVEPVTEGTNRSALLADIDILAHPGLITEEDARLARKRNVFLEITARSGHANTNNHVVEMAKRAGADLIVNIDSHTPQDIILPEELSRIAERAGLSKEDIYKVNQKVSDFIKRKTS
ncbi:MAG: histidinol phosphate phosphatase domain-containing protein [Candidatus Omnitrophica bacterium]|nr:histidinol phosphate phosphatase domain-containing protein [Candidatus Omnitrophota bacterium]